MTKEKATAFFAHLFYGEHHIPRGGVKEFGDGWCVNRPGDIATYDYNELTRLVVMAHDCCIRASIMQGGPGQVKICIWERKREGSMSLRHPILEDHIRDIRDKYTGDFKTLLV